MNNKSNKDFDKDRYMYDSYNQKDATFLICILCAIILCCAFFYSFVSYWRYRDGDKALWNDGKCIECGGNYIYKGSDYFSFGNRKYYYKCEDCDYEITLHTVVTD